MTATCMTLAAPSPSQLPGTEWSHSTPLRPGRTAADFAYPLSSGDPVPAASLDGLCLGCAGAWPCTQCPDTFGN